MHQLDLSIIVCVHYALAGPGNKISMMSYFIGSVCNTTAV